MMKDNIYIRAMSPVLLVGKLTTILPHSTDKTGRCGFHIISWTTIYSVIVYMLIVQNELQFAINWILVIIRSGNYNIAIIKAPTLLTVFYVIVSPIVHWTIVNRVADYWHRWTLFQEKVEICFGSCPLAKSKLSPKFVMVLLLTFNLLMCASAQANVYHWHMGRLMWHWLFGLFQISYIVTLWIMNCTFIKKYAEMCADELKKALISTETSSKKMRGIIDVWLELSEQVEKYSQCYASMFLLTFNSLILLVIVTSYAGILLNAVNDGRVPMVIFSNAMWLSFIHAACNVSHVTNEKMTYNMQKIMLQTDLTKTRTIIHHEVAFFLNTIKTVNPKLSVGNIMPVNRELLLLILSNGITYLIVLRQIGISI